MTHLGDMFGNTIFVVRMWCITRSRINHILSHHHREQKVRKSENVLFITARIRHIQAAPTPSGPPAQGAALAVEDTWTRAGVGTRQWLGFLRHPQSSYWHSLLLSCCAFRSSHLVYETASMYRSWLFKRSAVISNKLILQKETSDMTPSKGRFWRS